MYKRLHDSVPDSLKLGKLSDFAFRCWTVGLSQADWYGRLTAEPEKFVVQCFPNRREVTPEQVKAALDEVADVMGEGLIHLYMSADGKQYLVFHKIEEHNPRQTHVRAASAYPPPPKGLCPCVRYCPQEGQGPFGGREFRFYPGLFSNTGKEEGGVHERADACFVVHERAGACLTVHDIDPSSPLLSLKGGRETGGCGGGQGSLDRLSAEFEALTGRSAFRSEEERAKTAQLFAPILAARPLEELLSVMSRRISRERTRGNKGPASMRYFVAVFSDPRSFGPPPQKSAPSKADEPAKPPAEDYSRLREIAESKLSALPEDELLLWKRDAESEADRSGVIAFMRPLYVKTRLADRAIRTFGISLKGEDPP